MRYSKNDILSMDEETFVHTFKGKFCIIEMESQRIVGYVTEIGLSAITNRNTRDNLPVSLKVNGNNINIFQVIAIEIR